MIKLIAAIDTLRGIADDKGIPWDLPSDKEYYHKKVSKGTIIMGYNTYKNHPHVLHGRTEYVLTSHVEPLRQDFKAVADLDTFLKEHTDVWVLGGQGVFEAALPYADELYITQVNGMYDCTKFFPSFENDFGIATKSNIRKENGIEYQFQVWKPKKVLDPEDNFLYND